MSMFHLIFFIWVLLASSLSVAIGLVSWCPHHGLFHRDTPKEFELKTDRFWEFSERTGTWVEIESPFDLVTCVDDNCTKVGSIRTKSTSGPKSHDELELVQGEGEKKKKKKKKKGCDHDEVVLAPRKRVSMNKMSETSVWATGESGSIYERFWNGVQWVLAPHDLPLPTEYAISVFIVNHTILALSESGNLYQMKISESSEPIWVVFIPTIDQKNTHEGEKSTQVLIKSGVVSHDEKRVYFCTKNGTLLELSEVDPPRWLNHGQPPGANVEAIADAGTMRSQVVYTISSIGDLYEYDRSSKPLWKKHIWRERASQDASLQPLKGSALHGLSGDLSSSLFLLTKDGKLVERRLQQRKWKWIVHGRPKDHNMTSITQAQQEDSNEKLSSLFLTSSTGSVFEYIISKMSGNAQETWKSHKHPPNAKTAQGISGLQFQFGRVLFALDDGRLAELHLPGMGGENSGPTQQASVRRKTTTKYLWTVLDTPETEGWNGEYCSEERGPMNCITGTKDEPTTSSAITRRRKGNQQQDYILPSSSSKSQPTSDEDSFSDNLIESNFRLRLMQSGRSFFLVTDGGFTFEYLYTESSWIWLRHEHQTSVTGAVGNYNGSLYVIDRNGSLLVRERSSTELAWINCTALRKGKQVIGGSPWDGIPGRVMKATAEDSLFFVSKNGRLLQFVVALRKFKWKDCKNPPSTRVACIVDQELFRENIVFVIGVNGRLYQYNKVTELWHEHYQSQHLVLSRLPGTAMRSLTMSLTGSIFMLSESGGLVEYHWNAIDGWNWVEHGAPHKGVVLVGSLGPSFDGKQLFSIGSDGNVYLRYMDQMTWKWKNCGFPFVGNTEDKKHEGFCAGEDFMANFEAHENVNDFGSNCNPKIASTRPIPFSEDSVIFELRDGRLAELKRREGSYWEWSRTIGTPTSLCMENYWTALAS